MEKPKVILIVEDNSDGEALKALVAKLKLEVSLHWLDAEGIGNIVADGQRFIRSAKGKIKDGNGCVAVLIDQDNQNDENKRRQAAIRRHCKAENVPLLMAIEQLEAWFLADAGCAKWLNVKRQKNADSIADPKAEVRRAYRKKVNKVYQQRKARLILAQQCDGTGPERSPSMKKALLHLQESPCMQE